MMITSEINRMDQREDDDIILYQWVSKMNGLWPLNNLTIAVVAVCTKIVSAQSDI